MDELDLLMQKRDFTGSFKDFEYKRPDVEAVQAKMGAYIAAIETAETYEAAKEAFQKYQDLDEWVFSLATCVFVRRMMDTTDAFYAQEMNFFDNYNAEAVIVQNRYAAAVLNSPFRKQFEDDYGPMLTVRMEGSMRIHTEDVIAQWAEFNVIGSDYQGVVATCHTEFQGKETNFYGLLKGMEDPDRAVRKEAYEKWAKLYEVNAEAFDALYIRLLENMNTMAHKLGFENYEPVAYMTLGRYGYGPEEMAEFRKQVREVVVPICNELRERQRQELGVDKLAFYDETLYYKNGNPEPAGTIPEQLECVRKAFHKIHPKAGEFFDLICDHELNDLDTRIGKTVGGYCRWMPTFRSPFIFSNLNGTTKDADVLTHEGGHGFAAYMYSHHGKNPIDALRFCPGETHEIQSMTMEYWAAPYIDDFFGGKEGGDQYRYIHMVQALNNLCFGCVVDEFQHEAFSAKKTPTGAELREMWKRIEKVYNPWRDYDGNEFLESGGYWMQKMHIFQNPFYFIQYALAQIGSLELYGRNKTKPEKAWADYFNFCHQGCTHCYQDTMKSGDLSLPYAPGTVARVIEQVKEDVGM